MSKIFNIINCCNKGEDIHKSEIDIPINNQIEKNTKKIYNKIIDEKEKIIDKKNELSNLKSTESNIMNEIMNETNNKNEENKKEKNKNKENQKSNKKNKNKRGSKSNKDKENKKDNKENKDNITVEEQKKILSNINKYKASNKKLIQEPVVRSDSILTLNDLILNVKSQEEKYENGSKLLLTGELFFYKEIIIQTNGLKDSMRKQKDEHVYFGIKTNNNSSKCFVYNDIIVNYICSIEEAETIETESGRVFEIFYNKSSKDYSLKFLHPNLILYYKINNFVYFNTGKEYYLLLGNVFMTISVVKNTPMEKVIVIQIEIENNKPKNYSFNQSQTPIKIGRTNNNELPIYCQSISKRHGLIEFSNNLQSFYYRDLGSTNSSTLLVKEGDNLKIKGIMNFKFEETPFRIQEIP